MISQYQHDDGSDDDDHADDEDHDGDDFLG